MALPSPATKMPARKLGPVFPKDGKLGSKGHDFCKFIIFICSPLRSSAIPSNNSSCLAGTKKIGKFPLELTPVLVKQWSCLSRRQLFQQFYGCGFIYLYRFQKKLRLAFFQWPFPPYLRLGLLLWCAFH